MKGDIAGRIPQHVYKLWCSICWTCSCISVDDVLFFLTLLCIFLCLTLYSSIGKFLHQCNDTFDGVNQIITMLLISHQFSILIDCHVLCLVLFVTFCDVCSQTECTLYSLLCSQDMVLLANFSLKAMNLVCLISIQKLTRYLLCHHHHYFVEI